MIKTIATLVPLKYRHVSEQLLRFGIVGVAATLTHLIMLTFLVSQLQFHPLVANIIAFAAGFIVSFNGHRLWTFAANNARLHTSLPKFFAVTVLNFALNESLYALFLTVFHWQYLFASLIVLSLVPLITFFISKFWAFA